MEIREEALPIEKESDLTTLASIVGLVVLLPFFHNQLITGPVINALFFVSVIILGVKRTFFIALIPSVIAMSVGLLPPAIIPIVPFIMIGNVIQIFSFDFLKKNYFLAVIVSSILKSLFIFLSGITIFGLILKSSLAESAALIISWPQLLTALVGGVIAYFILKFIKKN